MNNGAEVVELTLQEQVDYLAWLHAEQRLEYMELVGRVSNIGRALAAMLAQQTQVEIQEQIENEIMNRLMTGGVITQSAET
jgi:hypothetical protein